MKTILLSTSCLWNCGDDFIREGVLNLLEIREDVRTIYWDRGYGKLRMFSNDSKVNISHMDYFIVAGTPQWVVNTEPVYKYCLKKGIHLSFIGIGMDDTLGRIDYEILMRKVASSGLCELALVRDDIAYERLKELGFKNVQKILDPAFFVKTLQNENKINILGWRNPNGYVAMYYFCKQPYKINKLVKGIYHQYKIFRNREKYKNYNESMCNIFRDMPEPKMVIIHDNREIEMAEKLFSSEYVFYSTDYKRMFEMYSRANSYIGSRIHGAIPCIIHNAPVNLIYSNKKANVLESSRDIISRYSRCEFNSININYFNGNRFYYDSSSRTENHKISLRSVIEAERNRIRTIIHEQRELKKFVQ